MSSQQTIAHYRVTAKLGEGGMGEVWRATDTKLNRDVAIKILPKAFAQDPERMARFTREAQVLASLNHPNIAQIYGVEEGALVMELVEGEPLKGPLPLETAMDHARQIADALEAAHEKGIVHRDLKPGNIMVTPGDVVKVLDFGLAKTAEEPSDNTQNSPTLTISPTRAGLILGTAPYMAPEQARGKAVDKRADIWAFGCVLYEMITGKQAFTGETTTDILAAVVTKEPDLRQVPAKVRVLLQNCLDKDPKSRLRDIGDVWRLLDETPHLPRAKNGLPWIIAAAALILTAATAGWAWWYRAPPADLRTYTLEIAPPDGESLYQDAISGFEAISPDGRTMAFIAESKGTRRIWVRPLDSLVARSLPGTELADGLFWSPDSRHLGFMAGTKLHRVEIATGAIKEICNTSRVVRGASWNADSTIIFGLVGGEIEQVSADAGIPAQVTVVDRDRDLGHNFPQFLPDGRHFLYLIQGIQDATTGIYIGSLDAAPEKQPKTQILATRSAPMYATSARGAGHLLYLRGKTLFAQPFDPGRLTLGGAPRAIAENVGTRALTAEFSVSQTGLLAFATAGNLARSVTIVSRDGTTIDTLGKPDNFVMARLSPDGHTLALVLPSSGVNRIWVMDMKRGVPTLFTNDSWISSFPTWSPDGKEIVFTSNRGGAYRMYRKALTGNGPERLIQATESNQYPLSWSRDGKAILYSETNAERNEFALRLLPLASSSAPISIASPVLPGGALSPSGRWVAFCSSESGTQEVYVQEMPGGSRTGLPRVRVSSAGGSNPAWSEDGNELFFNSLDDRLMSVAVNYLGGRFETGQPKELFALGGSSSFRGAIYWAPIGNGQRFVVLRSVPVPARDNRINIVINWVRGGS